MKMDANNKSQFNEPKSPFSNSNSNSTSNSTSTTPPIATLNSNNNNNNNSLDPTKSNAPLQHLSNVEIIKPNNPQAHPNNPALHANSPQLHPTNPLHPNNPLQASNPHHLPHHSSHQINQIQSNQIDTTIEKKDKSQLDYIIGYNPNAQAKESIELLHTLPHSSVVCSVKFSLDGQYLASGSNRSAQVYDVATGEKTMTFNADDSLPQGSNLYIRSVCFSPDNKFLAAGAEDKTVKIWSLETKKNGSKIFWP